MASFDPSSYSPRTLLRDTLAFRSLLTIAHQRPSLDEPRCRLVLELLSTAAAVRQTLQRQLEALQLTELKLGTLVVLFVVDPAPATPADLAMHVGATRSAMSDVVAQLEQRALIQRIRAADDRRSVHISLTDDGRKLAETALVQYLQNISRLAGDVDLHAEPQLLALCTQLNQRCLQGVPSDSSSKLLPSA